MKKIDIDKELIKAWMRQGKDDLLFAKTAFEETKFYNHICCLCQQAVEKYLKAIILAGKGKITKKEKIHNLNILAQKCKPLMDLSQFNEELRILTQAYIPARYPDESYFKVFSKKEAKESIEIAKELINFIEEKLKEILK